MSSSASSASAPPSSSLGSDSSGLREHRSSGCIVWPDHLPSSGEGGMWVLAVVEDDHAFAGGIHQDREQRPFERCHMDTLPQMTLPNVLVETDPSAGEQCIHCSVCGGSSPWDYAGGAPSDRCPDCGELVPGSARQQSFPLQERYWPHYQPGTRDALSLLSVPFLASVTLGSSTGAWLNTDNYWTCSRADLTDAGEDLIRNLEQMYGRPVHLLTFVDT